MALPAIEMIARLASQRRMGILPDASAGAPHHFPIHRVESGASVITDGWMGHIGITGSATAMSEVISGLAASAGRTRACCCPGSTRAGRALAAGHPPGLGRGHGPAELPERVLLPLHLA